jgi:hypothetical protein
MKALPAAARADLIEQLNREYALILLGERPAILREGDRRRRPARVPPALGQRLSRVAAPRRHLGDATQNGTSRKVQGSKVWVDSDDRRQYEGLVFDPANDVPTATTTTSGKASPSSHRRRSCQKLHRSHRENVCCGDEALRLGHGLVRAAMVQRPTDKLGTSLVLRGAQGTGKTIVGRIIGSLLGPHYALVADSRYIVGRFNAHLANCLMLQLDEATWGGDHAAAGKLKDLITGEYQYIEYKGKEPVASGTTCACSSPATTTGWCPRGSRNAGSPCSTWATIDGRTTSISRRSRTK